MSVYAYKKHTHAHLLTCPVYLFIYLFMFISFLVFIILRCFTIRVLPGAFSIGYIFLMQECVHTCIMNSVGMYTVQDFPCVVSVSLCFTFFTCRLPILTLKSFIKHVHLKLFFSLLLSHICMYRIVLLPRYNSMCLVGYSTWVI